MRYGAARAGLGEFDAALKQGQDARGRHPEPNEPKAHRRRNRIQFAHVRSFLCLRAAAAQPALQLDGRGAYFADYPAMQGLVLPEDSHLSRTCATVFTDAYVRAVAGLSPALTVRAAAPPPLSAADCNAAVPRRHATSAAVGKPTDP
jgi:hypothetical protein